MVAEKRIGDVVKYIKYFIVQQEWGSERTCQEDRG